MKDWSVLGSSLRRYDVYIDAVPIAQDVSIETATILVSALANWDEFGMEPGDRFVISVRNKEQ